MALENDLVFKIVSCPWHKRKIKQSLGTDSFCLAFFTDILKAFNCLGAIRLWRSYGGRGFGIRKVVSEHG